MEGAEISTRVTITDPLDVVVWVTYHVVTGELGGIV
jgi:hypothetical protein